MKAICSAFVFVLFSSVAASSQTKWEAWWTSMAPFDKPLGLVRAPGLDDELFVVEQRGSIYRLKENRSQTRRTLFLDLSQTVTQKGFETGLLSLAFHPEFASNRKFYLSYTQGEGKELTSHIAEMQVKDLPSLRIDESKTRILISQAQPYSNHNGGGLIFGPDGYLYFSWGDGGSAGDPQNNAQNLGSLLGKIHRIDVNHPANGKPYGIPKDNPFGSVPGARPEIFAYGLRNVWQMSFDLKTGKLWAGDVGQNAFEEVDIVEKGKNYGWRYFEALSEFKPTDPKPENAMPPVWNYSQKDGDKSITGGFVYHGPVSDWEGGYFCADFITGRTWIFHPARNQADLLLDRQSPPVQITCFGQSREGDVLVASYADGVIYRLVPSGK